MPGWRFAALIIAPLPIAAVSVHVQVTENAGVTTIHGGDSDVILSATVATAML